MEKKKYVIQEVGRIRLGFEASAQSSKLSLSNAAVLLAQTDSGAIHVELFSVVESNGRFEVPAGIKGVVKKIHQPFMKGRTTNILQVDFSGKWQGVRDMKFSELNLKPGQSCKSTEYELTEAKGRVYKKMLASVD